MIKKSINKRTIQGFKPHIVRRLFAVCLLSIFFFSVLLFIPLGVKGQTVIDSYSVSNYDSDAPLVWEYPDGWLNCAYGQTFNVASAFNLSSVSFYVYTFGSPDFYMQVLFCSMSGTLGVDGAPNSVIVSSGLVDASSAPYLGWLTFEFSPTLINSGNYAFVVVGDSGVFDGSNYLFFAYDGSSPSHDGNMFRWEGGVEGDWVAYSDDDLIFNLYGGSSPTGGGEIIGEIYIWSQWAMSASDSDPSAYAITSARKQYGVPITIDASNYGYPYLTEDFIDYFHASGVKVISRMWSWSGDPNKDGSFATQADLDYLLHSTDPSNPLGGSVDYQMSIGSNIDGFMFDESQTAMEYYSDWYGDLADYIHALNKTVGINPAGGWTDEATLQKFDRVSMEFTWWGAINEVVTGKGVDMSQLLEDYPNKVMGASNDWGYNMYPWHMENGYIAPVTALGNRPACGVGSEEFGVDAYTVTEDRAVWDTITAWQNGIYYMHAMPNSYGIVPSWFGSYVQRVAEAIEVDPRPTPQPTISPTPTLVPTVTPNVDGFDSGRDINYGLLVFALFIIALETLFILLPKGWINIILGIFGVVFALIAFVVGHILPSQPYLSIFMLVWSILTVLRVLR